MDVNTKKVSLNLSLEEYLLDGNPITHMEAVVLFGVSCLRKCMSKLRVSGYRVRKQQISYIKVLTRINKVAVIEPPKNLPIKELEFTEWWIEQ